MEILKNSHWYKIESKIKIRIKKTLREWMIVQVSIKIQIQWSMIVSAKIVLQMTLNNDCKILKERMNNFNRKPDVFLKWMIN
jgi:hypothetical protein